MFFFSYKLGFVSLRNGNYLVYQKDPSDTCTQTVAIICCALKNNFFFLSLSLAQRTTNDEEDHYIGGKDLSFSWPFNSLYIACAVYLFVMHVYVAI